MSITRPEHQGAAPRPADLAARVVVTAGTGPHQVTVDITSDPNASARLIIGGQQIAAPGWALQAAYAVLHGIYGGGALV